MKPYISTSQDERWPIVMDTDAGRIYLTIQETESLIKQLEVTLYILDSIKRQSDTEIKFAA
jgi:hypothetical protein